ncbi:hypothetical protein KP001_07820 [Geomonas subterranea]|uniref:Uncharacterized protein n=1 Tax=Geomonas subterranea TaxID=2847989 RepID=A0ABX8LK55_9BACT|nr:hypothetical protein [Geomonas subterranea]QXE92420.1 hypothetical protein KP001_07820 [Geomonas subterranea]QXM09481.1 hypothetical protein KP002_21450 [Geomonas subterranea]
MKCDEWNTKRKRAAESIIKRTWEMSSAVGLNVSWVGIDYGLPIEARASHVLGMVVSGRSYQVVFISYLLGIDSLDVAEYDIRRLINSCGIPAVS